MNEHPDDEAVDEFALQMKAKLAAAREKGRGGWQTCSPLSLSEMLRDHVEKGDPRDVANFCMFLWHHVSPILAAPVAQPLTDEQIDAVFLRFCGSNDNDVPYLRTYGKGFRPIARAILAAAGAKP
jgi:hypothetical protein